MSAEGELVPLDRGWGVWPLAGLRAAGMPFDLLAPLAIPEQVALPSGPAREAGVHAATSAALRRLFTDERLGMALTWQNPDVVESWAGRYLTPTEDVGQPPTGRVLRRETNLARYALRYCAKADTIGFFGPVSFARIGAPVSTLSGTPAIRTSRVYVECWAVQLLAAHWNGDPALRPHLPVHLDPACTVLADRAIRPRQPPLTLSGAERELLANLAAGDGRPFGRLAAVAPPDAVDRLTGHGVLRVGFRVPLCPTPEQVLRDQVEQVLDVTVRERLSSVLTDLDDARRVVADAGSPEALLAAVRWHDRRLAVALGTPGTPARPVTPTSDKTRRGRRTPLYLDCRSDLDVSVGPELLASLREPLGVLLDSARWLTGQIGTVIHDAMRGRYRELRRRNGDVDLDELMFCSADLLALGTTALTDVVDDFRLRWSEILPSGDADATIPVEEARRLADVLFPERGRRWAAGRTHSPDVLPRRTADGDVRWVLGELHLALNTLQTGTFRQQADDVDEMIALLARYSPAGRVVPVYPGDAPDVSGRSYPPPKLDPPGMFRYFSYGSDDGHYTGARSTPVTDLFVSETDGELIATSRHDGWAAPVLECFGEFLTALSANLFSIRPPAAYLPRVDIGSLTVCRRTWLLSTSEFGAVRTRAADPAHDGLRAWAQAHGMPRHVFVRAMSDDPARISGSKPFYVDFLAPASVDALAREVLRGGATAHWEFREMLPAPDELWLRGPDGSRYTSEIRLIAIEPGEPRPASWRVGS